MLNLVFAGLGVIGFLVTWAMYFGGMTLGPRNRVIEIARESPAYMSFLRWSIMLGAIAVVALAVSGIGLLKMRLWGRKLAIAYGLYGIASGIAGLVMSQRYLFGPLSESHDVAGSAGIMGGYAGAIFGLAYPIILLAFMFKRTVVAALQRANEPPLPPARI